MGSVSAHLIENSRSSRSGWWTGMWTRCVSWRPSTALKARCGPSNIWVHAPGNPQAKVRFFMWSTAQGLLRNRFQQGSAEGFEPSSPRATTLYGRFFAAALSKLRAAGFQQSQIETETGATLLSVSETNPQAARTEASGRRHGRRGMNKSFSAGKFLTASARNYPTPLWLVP